MEPRANILYFCDEASFLNEEYMGVAGLAVSRTRVSLIVGRLAELRTEYGGIGEIKWQNTRRLGLAVRRAYLNYLAELIADNHVHFHIRFSPMNEYEHEGKRREFDTASKSFYQLLLHRAVRYYGKTCQIFVRPDNGECTRLLPRLIGALHIDGHVRYKADANCVDSIIPVDSKKEPMLQFLDVALGALTAHRNGRHLLETVSVSKRDLAEHALPALGIRSLKGNRDDGNKLSIWNVVPKKRGPQR